MKIISGLFCSLIVFTLGGCVDSNRPENTLFELVPADQTGVHFSNTIRESDSLSILTFDYLYNGGGVAIGDINRDGLPDLFFTGNQVSCQLYLNKGNFQFEDITEKAGLTTQVWTEGATMADINHDGYLDIYVCTSSRNPSHPAANLLFINRGNLTFTEKASEYGLADTGYNTQAAFFDYDRDGDLDMYLLNNATGEPNKNTTRPRQINGESHTTDRLYRNEEIDSLGRRSSAHPIFVDVSYRAGILVEGYGLGMALGDLNGDGWTDIYTSNDFLSADQLYLNSGKGRFSNEIARLLKHTSYNGMGVDIADINNDGWLDIFELDMLPETNRRQKLMFGSVNYDRFRLNLKMGYNPQYVRNNLQLNNGITPHSFRREDGTKVPVSFSEVGQLAGVYSTDWSWSALLADYDNDGFRDLLITNGYGKDITDQDYTVYSRAVSQFGTEQNIRMQLKQGLDKITEVKMPNYLFRNNGRLEGRLRDSDSLNVRSADDSPTFTNQSAAWGMREASISNGAAYADLDRDGDLDLVINNLNEEAFIYRNNSDSTKTHFLQIMLAGDSLNTGGIGTKIWLRSEGKLQFYEHYTTRGYKSSMDPTVHFGLGNVPRIDTLEVRWPDGTQQIWTNVPANQRLQLEQKNAKAPSAIIAVPVSPSSLLQLVTDESAIAFRHQEKDFSDFRVQPLIPFKHSQSGPGIAVADVNGDGLDDGYVGGAAGYPGELFVQHKNGHFNRKPLLKPQGHEEDMGSLFFDADGDGDLDLYVVSGGSEFPMGSKYYQDRLYRNNGKGSDGFPNLIPDPTALPAISTSGSCVVAADYDRDGDLDLFVGGRVSPGQYPLPPRSYLLRNDGGVFHDATATVCPELWQMGMISAALWTDFDTDGQPDLIVTGEWMPLIFLKNNHGRLLNVTRQTGLVHTEGLWNSLTGGDFDNDGDIDYIAGNLGLNARFQASEKEPLSLHAKDFDRNGSLDPILSYYIGGQNHPAPPRDDMIDQIVALRGRFPRYADYAKATFEQIFTPEELRGAHELKARQLQTCYLENLGKGKFVLRPLPMRAQFAPVFGVIAQDFDGDANLDVLLTGNSYSSDILTGWYDASVGAYFRGDGQGNFSFVPAAPKNNFTSKSTSSSSGFFVDGDAKGLALLSCANGSAMILAACNDDSLRVFRTSVPWPWKSALAAEEYAEVQLKNGKKRREELYYGSGYLSQSSRGVRLSPAVSRVTMHKGQEKKRDFQ